MAKVMGAVTLLLMASVCVGDDLCGYPQDSRQSGFLPLEGRPGDKEYYYWLYKSRGDPSTDPLILWLTGGPCAASEVAIFEENGPCKITESGQTTVPNPFSWISNATVLWVDQPVGTGFSFGESHEDWSMKDVSEDMYAFFKSLFKKNPELASLPLYVFGESYGGHYAPAIAHYFWLNAPEYKLTGLAIGNGLVDPINQYPTYPDTASAVLNASTVAQMRLDVPQCTQLIKDCTESNDKLLCNHATVFCNNKLWGPYLDSGLNPYDMRLKCEVKPLCYNFSRIETFLTNTNVIKTLGTEGHPWESVNVSCSNPFTWDGDWLRSYSGMIPPLLASGIKVLVYYGDEDYYCGTFSSNAWTAAMKWPGQQEFNKQPFKPWHGNGTEPSGSLKSFGNFTLLRVFEAGHLVPHDKPNEALHMVKQFLHDSFN
eukprot:TRINITY_DN12754_c0_g1_i1.p1 TRINITY_DN12754_c0_g1~~TRINITY_DN12754_c0_g1_i1.p1  ORF type:complete len:427 (+),score=43.95 TRINITY_DN12754_c0_g1_i1:517-1797(+)